MDEQKETKRSEHVAPVLPILETKLYAPPALDTLISRARLLQMLERGERCKLILISAPAGSGKTTLVSDWLQQSGIPLAWVALDAGDNQTKRFLSYLLTALQRVIPSCGDSALRLLQSPQPPPTETLVTLFLNDLARYEGRVVLILDDYHLIDSQEIDEILSTLLRHQPQSMQLVLLSREDPQLPLSRMRVRGELLEIRAADLRFTKEETGSFMHQSMGLPLSEQQLEALELRTEGWVAGLQLAALSMRGREDISAFIDEFTGDHRFVLDYLAEEVLQKQPPSTRSFLLRTSVLKRLSGDSCDAVTGNHDGIQQLDTLERENLFLIQLDQKRRWFRYHHLFADVLRAYAQKELATELPILHRRASEWFAQQGDTEESLHHALAAGDMEQAAALVELSWPEMDSRFQSGLWLQWCKKLPEELIGSRPVLCVGMGWALLNKGLMKEGDQRMRQAEVWLQQVEELGEKGIKGMVVVDQKQFEGLQPSILTARAYITMATGSASDSVAFAKRALALLPEDRHVQRGPANSLLGLLHWANGDLQSAFDALSHAMNDFFQAGYLQFALSGNRVLAWIQLTRGNVRGAIEVFQRALERVRIDVHPPIRGTADIFLGLAELSIETGELEKAKSYLLQSETWGIAAGLSDWPSRYHLVKAQLAFAERDFDEALHLLEKAQELYFPTPLPEVRSIAVWKLRVWIHQGRIRETMDKLREMAITTNSSLSFLHEFAHITLSRALLAQYRSERTERSLTDAIELLGRLLEKAITGGRGGSALEISILQALAFREKGEREEAYVALERALQLAAPEHFVQIFVQEGQHMASLLAGDITCQPTMEAFLQKIRFACGGRETPNEAKRISQPLLEPLTQREMDVLELIAEGLSNQEICERLHLALSTIKGYNRNIFGKLAVKRRTEAVAKARELGLI